jgi:UDP-GlcNAc3NAcA epimerase
MKLVSIVGARPQFIKCAGVSHALERMHAGVEDVILHTGQHYDVNMSDVFFRDLALPPPAYNLGVGSGPHGAQTGDMLREIERVLIHERPQAVVVYGDTNSTLAGALAAAKLRIPIAHVEAGMRSFNRRVPEEINRVVTDHISDMLLCPTDESVRNLAAEGIVRGVALVGNVMRDSLLDNLELAERTSRILERLQLERGSYSLATVHRAENTDDSDRLLAIVSAMHTVGQTTPVIWPMHPRTRARLEVLGAKLPGEGRVRVIEPLAYHDMLTLEQHARVILTDSGGVTTEAFWLGVPCVTLRDETEWTETVETGWNTLVGADTNRIVDAAGQARRGCTAPTQEARGACERVARLLVTLGAGDV